MENNNASDRFQEFLQLKEVDGMLKSRLVLNMNEIRQFNRELGQNILNDPLTCIPYFEDKLSEFNISHLGFTGSFGLNSHTPRTIRSAYISKMVCIEGIVTSLSVVRPKIKKSVHYCKPTNTFYEKDYRDSTIISKLPPTNTIYPVKTPEGLPLLPEYGLSEYTDFQALTIQEMPENSPPGLLPRDIQAILTNDLVDSVKPGDRVKVYGIYKSFAGASAQFPTRFKIILIINHVSLIKEAKQSMDVDLSKLKLLSLSDLKYKAIAPTIFGHDDIKKALALMMVGGNEKIMKNGSRIRGDINILLVGDPSTAKSQLLRYMVNMMPLSVATTGRGSSGVGLTAAVVVDKDTGEKRLEAGAMVIADRGVVCIDEFDKMNDIDRVAIHEVMEQQTVTIAKAGIHTTLNARCSVLAAANPIYGNYNEKLSVQDNVNLPESLMTRFDLVFITRDSSSVENDSQISKHVLKMRSFEEKQDDQISQELFKSFIMHAKTLRPVLSKEAANAIIHEYTQMRQKKNNKELIVNITPRFLETMIRLSTACAKLRLSEIVEIEDAEEAIKLLNGNICKRVTKSSRAKRIKVEEPAVSLGQELKSAVKDDIVAHMWRWRNSHPEEACLLLSDLADLAGVAIATIEEVVMDLSNENDIMYADGRIYFINE